MTGPDLLAAALAYATAGVPVVPLFEPVFGPHGHGRCSCGTADCRRPGKHPRNHGGLTAASTTPAAIAEWWARWPTANIGGRTGAVFDVCDVDGPAGITAVTPLLGARHGRAPIARTGSGGWHLFFAPTGLGNRTRFLPDTDWRGHGGYVVLPPSRHISGQRYTFARPIREPLPTVPAPLRDALTPSSAAPLRRSPRPPVARSTTYAHAALDHEAQRVRTAPQGRRNDTLNRAAFNLGQLIATGQLTDTDAIGTLTDAALRAGLTETEIARTVSSGLTAGQRHPRTRIAPAK